MSNFHRLTDYYPFEWQKELFVRFVNGDIPSVIDIPTGCGKTKVMQIWLLALAYQGRKGWVTLPRRLVWIVNRRAVVDQATEEAEKTVKALQKEELQEVRESLLSLSLDRLKEPVAVSTLRGELADNEEWKKDPSRPSIIVGTIDMIGSKLLFSGYGDSAYYRSMHAGLLAVDALIVHDEAHLTPAFQSLLESISRLHDKPVKPFRVIQLTATQRKSSPSLPMLEDERLKPRIEARKILFFHESSNLVGKICELALAHERDGSRVLVYVRRPSDAQKIADEISKKARSHEVAVLTGRIRGYERDEKLVKGKVLRHFKPAENRPKLDRTVYLISTSAGEVGIDLDADHCITDLCPIDSLIQRLGRVNRLGQGKARVDLVCNTEKIQKDPLGASMLATLQYLKGLPDMEGGKNVSPITFKNHPPPQEAFTPQPPTAELAPSLLDCWTMTSIDKWPGKPSVDLWLHGLEEIEEEMYLVWRKDAIWLASAEVEEEYVKECLLEEYGIRTREKLRAEIKDVKEFMKILSKRNPQIRVILIRQDGSIWRGRASEVMGEEGLEQGILILPPEAGGLDERGMLDFEVTDPVKDVADEEERGRFHVIETEEGWKVEELRSGEVQLVEDWKELITKKGKILLKIPLGEEPMEYLVYVGRLENIESQLSGRDVELEEHEKEVETIMKEFVSKLNLQFPELIVAARYHDEGKRNPLWQDAIGNENPSRPLAKSKHNRFNPARCPHYRHEFGSIEEVPEGEGSPLTFHLILASHRRGRPPTYFPPGKEELAIRCIMNFIELQNHLGWWNLAYLEALLKAADILVSTMERSCPGGCS